MGMTFISKLFKGKRGADTSAPRRSVPSPEQTASGDKAKPGLRSRAYKIGRSKSLPVQLRLSNKPALIKGLITVQAPRVVRRAKSSGPQKAVAQVHRSPARVTFADQIETSIQVARDEIESTDKEVDDRESGTAYALLTEDGQRTKAFIKEIYDVESEVESEKPPVAKPKPATEVSQPVFCSMESIEIAEVVVIGKDSKAARRPELRRQNAAVKTETRQQPRAKEVKLSECDLLPQAAKSTLTVMLKRALKAAQESDIPSFIEDAGLRVQSLANQSFLRDKDSVDTALGALLSLDPEKQTEQNDLVALLWYVSRCCELASLSKTSRTTDWVTSNAISIRDALDAKVDAYFAKCASIALDPLAQVKL